MIHVSYIIMLTIYPYEYVVDPRLMIIIYIYIYIYIYIFICDIWNVNIITREHLIEKRPREF